MATRAVLFDLLGCWAAGILRNLEVLGLSLELLLDADLLGVLAVVVEVRHGSACPPLDPGRSGRQSTAFAGSYGYHA